MQKLTRIIAFAVVVSILLCSGSAFAAETDAKEAVLKQTSASVKLLEKAGSGKTLATLKSGDAVLVWGVSGNYSLVETGGKTGYVATRSLKAITSSANAAGVAIAKEDITLYQSASANSKKIASAKKESLFSVLAQGAEWTAVRQGTTVGAVKTSSLTIYNENTAAIGFALAKKAAKINSDASKSAKKLATASQNEIVSVLYKINSTTAIVKKLKTVGVMSMSNTQLFDTASTGTVETAAAVTVYSGASTKLTKLGSLKKADIVDKLGIYGSYTVILYNGAAGCVTTKNIKSSSSDAAIAAENAVSSSTGAIRANYIEATVKTAIYSKASATGSIIGYLEAGAITKYYGVSSDGKWVQINYGSHMLYVQRQDVKESAYNPPSDTSSYDDDALELIAYMNAYRKQAGAAALTVNDLLMKAALVRAEEITRSFSHIRPNGKDCTTVDPANVFGENIAKGSGVPTAASAAKAFMESPDHKANAMRSTFKSTGVAAVKIGDTYYWVQLFGY